MASKTVQISARISREDAEFLSKLSIDGAKTPSDKLRAIITQARQRSIGTREYTGTYKMIQDLVLPVSEHIRKCELDQTSHSAFIFRVLEWLPDFTAFVTSSLPEEQKVGLDLEEYEKGVVNRVFTLFESIMQMGVGAKNPCYDPDIISKKLESILALSKIINTIDK